MNFKDKIHNLLKLLSEYKTNHETFNPWGDYDFDYDFDNSAPLIRVKNLRDYLLLRENAKFILIAEALSYQGGKFTGIAMTSEKLLKIRTSNSNAELGNNQRKLNGFSENTATIVENTLIKSLDINPIDFIKWNIYPFHPHKINNSLSNRTPNIEEIKETIFILRTFLDIFQNKKIIAIGNISFNFLKKFLPHIKLDKVRHPSNGGANDFKKQIQIILSKRI